jgi:phytoene dehydrogenase-like protein
MYDTIVIGRDLSSLIAALALSRGGKKTILVEEGREVDYQETGYTFSNNSSPCSGLGSEQMVQRLLKKLHPLPDEAPQFLQMDPAFQVILPGHKIDFSRYYNDLTNDIIREFPHCEQVIRKFYKTVAKNSELIEKWIKEDENGESPYFRMMLRRLCRLPVVVAGCCSLAILAKSGGEVFKKVIKAQHAILSNLYVENDVFPLSMAYLLSLPSRGIFYPIGGKRAWLNWLKKGIIEAGGVILEDSSIIRMDTKPNVNVDLESSGLPTTLRSHNLIVSAQWEKINLFLGEQKVFRKRSHFLTKLEPAAYPLCVHLGVKEECIPEKMAPLTIFLLDKLKPAKDQNLLLVETSLPGEATRAPEGRRAVSITTHIKGSPLKLTDLEIKGFVANVIDSLEIFLPFLRENIDYINIEKTIALSRQCQDVANQKYQFSKTLFSGMRSLSPKTPLPNVFLTGAIMRAGLGFEGEILSGLDAAISAGFDSVAK